MRRRTSCYAEDAIVRSRSTKWQLCARSALEHPASPRSGCRQCVNLVSNSSNIKFPTLLKGSYGVRDARKSGAAGGISHHLSLIFSTSIDYLKLSLSSFLFHHFPIRCSSMLAQFWLPPDLDVPRFSVFFLRCLNYFN